MSKLLFSKLGVVCSRCDAYHPPETATCTDCQAPLLGVVPAALKPAAPSSIPPAQPTRAPPAPPSQSQTTPARVAHRTFTLTIIDGPLRGRHLEVSQPSCRIGRRVGEFLLAEDPFVSPFHATLELHHGRLYVRDEGSTSGVLVSIREEKLAAKTDFCVGHRLFRYEGQSRVAPRAPGQPVPYGAPLPSKQEPLASVEEILVGNRPGRSRLISAARFTFGQVGCDWSFPGEFAIAPRHCELLLDASTVTLKDVSGGLGTFVRIREARLLVSGSLFRIGKQLLRVEL